jgi:voltage-gated potassium channel
MEERTTIRRRTWEVLEVGDSGDQLSRAIDVMILSLVVCNVIATILVSVESLSVAYHDLFVGFEIASIAAFTAEFLSRLWSSADSHRDASSPVRNRLKYLFSPFAIVDILAIAPFYLSAFFALDLRFLRILRLLRIVKLSRYSPA